MNNAYTNFNKNIDTPLKKGEKRFCTSKCFCGCDITYGTKYGNDYYNENLYNHPHFKTKKCIKFIYNKYHNKKIWFSKNLKEEYKEIKINTITLEDFIIYIQLLHKKKEIEPLYNGLIYIDLSTSNNETKLNSYYKKKHPKSGYKGDIWQLIPNIIYIENKRNKTKEIIYMTPKNIV